MNSHKISVEKGIQIEVVSLVWMIVESVVAISSGVIAHSLSLVAFGTDSVIELIAGSVLLWRLIIEAQGANLVQVMKAEKKSSWVVGIALLVLGGYIGIASIDKLWTHQGAESSFLGMCLAVAAGIIMPILSKAKKRIGTEIGSNALRSDGSCSMVCAYMAWTVLAGVLLTTWLGWWWIDSMASLGLIYFVFKEGWEAIQIARGKIETCSCQDDESG